MRKRENLKIFGHAAKSKTNRSQYTEAIYGEETSTRREENTLELDGTAPKPQPAGTADSIPRAAKPYTSWETTLKEQAPMMIVTALIAILIGFSGWVALTLNSLVGEDIQQGGVIDNIENDVDDLQTQYKELNDRSIRSETLIDAMRGRPKQEQ